MKPFLLSIILFAAFSVNGQIKYNDTSVNRFFYISAMIDKGDDGESFQSFYWKTRNHFPSMSELMEYVFKDNPSAIDAIIMSIYEFKSKREFESFYKPKQK